MEHRYVFEDEMLYSTHDNKSDIFGINSRDVLTPELILRAYCVKSSEGSPFLECRDNWDNWNNWSNWDQWRNWPH